MRAGKKIGFFSASFLGGAAMLVSANSFAQSYPCYVAYIHGSGTDLHASTTHEGFGNPIPADGGGDGDLIERQWTPDRSPSNTTVNSFTYYSSRQYDSSPCAVYRVGYNGLSSWWADDSAGAVASQINDFITRYDIPDRQLIIVTHSMGGVVGRWILDNGASNAPYLNYNGDYGRIVQKTKYMITVEAPHWGTQVADAIYGEANHYFSDTAGAMALWFGGQDQTDARNSMRRAYMRDAADWMGDSGRNRTMYTIAGESVDDDAGQGMDDDGSLQTAWAGVCYRRAWFNGWGSLCGTPGIAAFTFNDVAGDGLVELVSAKAQTFVASAGWRGALTTRFVAGAYRHWLELHQNHNQGRYDMHYANVTDRMANTTTGSFPASYIGNFGLNLPCSTNPNECWRGTPP